MSTGVISPGQINTHLFEEVSHEANFCTGFGDGSDGGM